MKQISIAMLISFIGFQSVAFADSSLKSPGSTFREVINILVDDSVGGKIESKAVGAPTQDEADLIRILGQVVSQCMQKDSDPICLFSARHSVGRWQDLVNGLEESLERGNFFAVGRQFRCAVDLLEDVLRDGEYLDCLKGINTNNPDQN